MSEYNQLFLSSIFEQRKQTMLKKLAQCDEKKLQLNANIIAQSDFLINAFSKNPNWLSDILEMPPQPEEHHHYQTWLNEQLTLAIDEASLFRILRQFRCWILVRIEWSQLIHSSTEIETLQQLSFLAELLIITARDWLYTQSCQEWGTPYNQEGNKQPLLILGMGKLGGGELNFSSDIDLIFTYPENGVTQGARKEIDNAIFFTRLAQRIIKALAEVTQDGFVYRVDMRLRPLGDGGPLVLSFAAMDNYYQEQGRDWERYAMIKAKVLGDQNNTYAKALYQMIRPFIYRRYIDFSVLQSLRNMKGMIEREVRRRGLKNNIKLGSGGIREIEFIVQFFQLIRGGRFVSLQTPSLLNALDIIEKEHLLPFRQTSILHHNYLFLRRCENLLQAINDKQTQTLPDDELDQIRLTIGMGFDSWDHFQQELSNRMKQNRLIFNDLIGNDELEKRDQKVDERFKDLWIAELEPIDIKTLLTTCSDDEALQIFQILLEFSNDIRKRTIGVRGREILLKLMLKLLQSVFDTKQPVIVLQRVLPLLLNIVSRTTYLELLLEYPTALNQLIKLCSASPMISQQLTYYPILLDELIDIHSLYQTTPIEEYKSQLYQYLLRIQSDDEEQQLEALRQFKQMQLLHIAAVDVEKQLPTMKISDHLTFVAEALIDFVIQMAWNQMVERYGQPEHLSDSQKGIIAVAYGKLGGFELAYNSDLDLVFLHDCPSNSMTTGNKVIDSRQFYLRLVQRIIHLFNVRTNFGILYEVDVRLRPQGDSGLLACSLTSFNEYQLNEAWTWEHQALVRARCVYGEPELIESFNQIRHDVLSKSRDENILKSEVREMRIKMREHLSSKTSPLFNLKIDEGGIGDIEFLSQFLVLNYAHQHPTMTRWTDNVRILALAADHGILTQKEAETLTNIYINMRNEIHQLALQNLPSNVEKLKFTEERKLIIKIWKKWLTCNEN